MSEFSLIKGGILWRLLVRGYLAREGFPHPGRRILLFFAITWLPLFVLTVIAGHASGAAVQIPFLHDVAPHARLAIALPLLILAEVLIDPRLAEVVKYLRHSTLIPESERRKLDQALDDATRLRESVLAEVIMLGLVGLMMWALMQGPGAQRLSGRFSAWDAVALNGAAHITPAGWWYAIVCLPLFQFLLLRWLWRIGIWIQFLWRLSRTNLQLQPAHPDQGGGLGFLASGQMAFGPLFFAMGAVLAASLANQIRYYGSSLAAAKPAIIAFVVLSAAIVIGPLFLFLKQMVRSKQRALLQYAALGEHAAQTFEQEWIRSQPNGPGLLGSSHASVLCDYAADYQLVARMRLVPVDLRGLVPFAFTLLLPFAPLALFEMSIGELLKKLSGILL